MGDGRDHTDTARHHAAARVGRHARWMASSARAVVSALVLALAAGAGLAAQELPAPPPESRLEIGQPLAIDLPLHDIETGQRMQSRECVEITVQQGDRAWPVARLRWQVRAVDTDGRWQLSLRSDERIEEPVVQARVTLQCGVPYRREFTLLADPPGSTPWEPTNTERTGTRSVRFEPSSELSAERHTNRPPPHAAAPTQKPSLTTPASPREAPRSMPPATPALTLPVARLQLDDVLDAAPPGAIPTTLAFSPALRPADARLHEALQGLWLQELQALHEEQRLMRLALAGLDTRMAQDERAARWQWLHWLLLGAGLVLAATLSAWLRDTLLRRFADPQDAAPVAATISAARAAPPALDAETAPRPDPTAALTIPVPEAEVAPGGQAEPGLSWLSPGDVPHDESPQSAWDGLLALTPPPAAPLPPPRQGLTPLHDGLDEPPTSPALAQIDDLIAKGFGGAAAAALEVTLQTEAGRRNPWILLRLLDLYRSLAQPWNHERVSADLEALYNVRVPPCAEQPGEGRGLEDHRLAWPRVCRLWTEPDAADQLARLLLRPTRLEVLDLAAFRDTLMLYAMSVQPQHDDATATIPPPAPPPAIEPAGLQLFDWSRVGLRV
jgi:hypothetical protein